MPVCILIEEGRCQTRALDRNSGSRTCREEYLGLCSTSLAQLLTSAVERPPQGVAVHRGLSARRLFL
jgi:hypothetical protein